MLLFRNARFDKPVAHLTFEKNKDPTLLPLLRMVHKRIDGPPDKKPKNAKVARYDLNRDGKLDSLVLLSSLDTGWVGSEVNILINSAKGWTEVGKIFVSILNRIAVVSDPKRAMVSLYGDDDLVYWPKKGNWYQHYRDSVSSWITSAPRDDLGKTY
jgi:hypothetical protein